MYSRMRSCFGKTWWYFSLCVCENLFQNGMYVLLLHKAFFKPEFTNSLQLMEKLIILCCIHEFSLWNYFSVINRQVNVIIYWQVNRVVIERNQKVALPKVLTACPGSMMMGRNSLIQVVNKQFFLFDK